jgi:maleate isomerase
VSSSGYGAPERGGELPVRIRPKPELLRATIDYDAPTGDIPIGVIVPFDFGIDWQYWRYVPPGVSLHFTRTPYLRKSVGIELARDVGRPTVAARATRTLSALEPAVVAYACSSGSFVNGVAGDIELRRAMLEAGAKRAVTTSGAMASAFRACGVTKVGLASPYVARLAAKFGDFVDEAGFEAVSNVHLGLTRGIVNVSKATIGDLVRAAARPEAEAVFVSCTGLRTLGMIASLEEEVGVPILTSNQVTLWDSLRAADALPVGAETRDDPVLGDASPMARATELLLPAASEARRVAG